MDQLALRELDASLRTRFDIFLMMAHCTINPRVPYRHSWHIDAMVAQAEAVMNGKVKRLIVNVPPRNFKSLTFNIALSAFILGHDPSKRIFCVSYGERLAEDHAAQFRAIVESNWYRCIFPNMRIKRMVNHDFITTEQGFRRWTSVAGALTGMGGDIIIVDDPIKPEDILSETKRDTVNSWFGRTLLPRLDDKETGVIVVLMQRLHQNDLCGYLLRETTGWTHLELPAIAIVPQAIPIGRGRYHHRAVGDLLHPDHESEVALADIRDTMGPAHFSAQYQQRPVPAEGEFLNPEWFRYYETLPERDSRSYVIQSWDTASKDGLASSYSACTTWLVHDGNYYLLDVFHGKLNFPALREMALALSQKYKPRCIFIEDASTGSALAAELKSQQSQTAMIRLVRPDQDKRVRLFIQQNKFAAGRIWFPTRASWLRVFLDELLSFPDSEYSDQVDSLSQALASKTPYDVGAINGALSSLTDSYMIKYAMAQSRGY